MRDLSGTEVLVTGAAGFIGSHLVNHLVSSRGCSIVAVDNGRSGDWANIDVDVVRIDRSIVDVSVEEWTELTTKVSTVFHLAAEKYNSSVSTPEQVIETNISATNSLAQGAGRGAVERFVFTSSLYAYGSLGPDPMIETDVLAPITNYGMSKVAGEHLLRVAQRDFGLGWNVARLFFIYGPKQYATGGYKSVIPSNFERVLRGDRPTVFGDGRQSLDYTYVTDCVDALVKLAETDHEGEVVNVSTGSAVSVNDLTELMLSVADSTFEPLDCPADWTEGTFRFGLNDKARDLLDWSPSIGLKDGLTRVWDWMRRNCG